MFISSKISYFREASYHCFLFPEVNYSDLTRKPMKWCQNITRQKEKLLRLWHYTLKKVITVLIVTHRGNYWHCDFSGSLWGNVFAFCKKAFWEKQCVCEIRLHKKLLAFHFGKRYSFDITVCKPLRSRIFILIDSRKGFMALHSGKGHYQYKITLGGGFKPLWHHTLRTWHHYHFYQSLGILIRPYSIKFLAL